MAEIKKYLDFTGLTNLVNSIKNLFSKSVADWNQNDENDYSYIKNRICYESDPIDTEFLAETSIAISEFYPEDNLAFGEISFNENLQIDQKYTVVFDGTIYENLVCFDDDGYPNLGSPVNDILGGSAEYPFCMSTYTKVNGDFLGMYVNDIVSTSHTVQITWYKTNIIKIEDKYLPDLPKGSFVGQKGTGSNAEIFNDYDNNVASGMYAHAEGFHARATGTYGHAEGVYSEASGNTSHAEGKGTVADGANVHAEGCLTTASASETHAEGYYTKASSKYQHVQGKCNIEDAENKYAHIVGNGTSDTERSNAHTLDWDGNAWFAGDVYVGGSAQSDTENVKKLITEDYVNNCFNELKTGVTLIDAVNGFNYIVKMENGQLVSYCADVSNIVLTSLPNKTTYIYGEVFDPTGMVITIECADGTTREATNYSYPETVTTTTITITCEDYNFNVNVIIVDVNDLFIDFDYTSNDDGTYTLTGWKETLNGESSTECVVPDSNKVVL